MYRVASFRSGDVVKRLKSMLIEQRIRDDSGLPHRRGGVVF
jgi:hypothetical protein